ncbi:MAG: hypothetical protein H6728_14395 [Myxococcales bacterium]|nr:hypothetical protein [Myxococcales bacterium]
MSTKHLWVRQLMRASAACALLLGVVFMPGCPAATNSGSCSADTDCANETKNKVCDKNAEKCVQCLKSENCATGEVCDTAAFTCRAGCNNADDCKKLDEFKDRAKVECRSSACVPACDSNEDCRADEKCEDSKCIVGQRENLPGKYAECPLGKCQAGLECLTYKGGTTNYCWKACGKGCDADEICVKAEDFAEGYDVCMKKVAQSGASYSFDQGSICADGMVRLLGSQNGSFGTCWDGCETQCVGNAKCVPHPNAQDNSGNPVKVCMTPCTDHPDCTKIVSDHKCKENPKITEGDKLFCF